MWNSFIPQSLGSHGFHYPSLKQVNALNTSKNTMSWLHQHDLHPKKVCPFHLFWFQFKLSCMSWFVHNLHCKFQTYKVFWLLWIKTKYICYTGVRNKIQCEQSHIWKISFAKRIMLHHFLSSSMSCLHTKQGQVTKWKCSWFSAVDDLVVCSIVFLLCCHWFLIFFFFLMSHLWRGTGVDWNLRRWKVKEPLHKAK